MDNFLKNVCIKEMKDPILEELASVARRSAEQEGKQVSEQLTFSALQSFVLDVITDTAHNKSSMLQDVIKRRPTEIQYLNGYVVRKGKECGVDTPANQLLASKFE